MPTASELAGPVWRPSIQTVVADLRGAVASGWTHFILKPDGYAHNTFKDAAKLLSEAAVEIERLEAELLKAFEDSDSYKASMKQYFKQSLSEHNAKVEFKAQRDKLAEALRNLLPLIYLENERGIGWRIASSDDNGHEWDGDALQLARAALAALEPKP